MRQQAPSDSSHRQASKVLLAEDSGGFGELQGLAGEPQEKLSRAALVTRAQRALIRVAREVSTSTLRRAAATRSDEEVFFSIATDPSLLTKARVGDPLAPARLRGARAARALLDAEGGTLSANEVAQHLRFTRQAVDKRRRAGRLIGLPVGRRGFAYPAWQLDEHGVVSGLDLVLAELQKHDPWMQVAFFLSGNSYLDGQTPLALLRQGKVDAVQRAARTYGAHGAA
jgi:hypothetical protein